MRTSNLFLKIKFLRFAFTVDRSAQPLRIESFFLLRPPTMLVASLLLQYLLYVHPVAQFYDTDRMVD